MKRNLERKFSKFDLILVATLLLVLVINIAVSGSLPDPGMRKASRDAVTVTGTGAGKVGDVVVEVTADKSNIYSIKVLEQNETPGIGSLAVEQLPAAIAGANSLAVDSISTATVTSDAIKAAVAAALTEAGFNPGDFGYVEPTPAPTPAPTPKPTPKPAAEAKPAGEAQTATAKGTGIGGDVVVEVKADANTIYEVNVLEQNETPGIGSVAVEKLPAAMVEANSIDVDGVTGATVTTGAIKTAVTEALTSMGFDPASYQGAVAAAAGDVQTATGTGTGIDGAVVVEVKADANTIYEVNVLEQNETPGIGSVAVEKLPGAIVEANSIDVDGVTGATVTTGAIKSAVTEALTSMGFDPASYQGAVAAMAPSGDVKTATGTGTGIDGAVVVEVKADANTIYEVNVLEQNETPGIGSVAVEKLPGAIVEANSIDVDGVTGATVTTGAIKTAVTEALTSMGFDPASYQGAAAAPAAPKEKTEVTLDCDVVVVGAGGAGLTASVLATQQGSDVILLEKMPFVGGNSLRAEGGMNAADTKVQAELGITDSTVDNFVDDTLRLGHNLANPDLVRTLSENSAEAVDWLFSIDAPLTKVKATGGTTHKYLHQPADGSPVGSYLVAKLSAKAEELGIDVRVNTRATEILMKDGQAVGVKAEDDEHIYTINAKSVVLATGGFGANFDLMASFDPTLANAVTTNHSGAQGDGIMMAQAVGADTVDMEQIQLHPTVIQSNGLLVSESLRSYGAIIVNTEGKRFVNDLAGRDVVSQAELKQPNGYCFIIFDQNMVDHLALTKKFIDGGYTVTADSYEELAKNMGLEGDAIQNFVNTMNAWNESVKKGEDAEFGRNNGMDDDLSTAPYYAIKIAPGIHHTMGGIKIDTKAEVIDTRGDVIPGLFACGETTGGIHGGNRVGGNAVCDFIVFGRIAGQSASDFAKAVPASTPAAAPAASAAGSGALKVETMSGVKVMHASDWAEQFPNQYNTWLQTEESRDAEDYLEIYPMLRGLYEGYGFAKDYKAARGHFYDVQDIEATGRPHPLANCWTCKTPDFTNMVNEEGVSAYQKDWAEVQKEITEGISCYSCHANTPGAITVTHTYWIDAVGDDFDKIAPANLACGQCHNEYYFAPDTKATTIAHNSLESMAPEKMLAFFNDGSNFPSGEPFADWTNPRTGVKQIKVQHPEFETFLGAGSPHANTFTCADCHMPVETAADGSTYHSHNLVSPLDNPVLIESTCSMCHKDFVNEVRGVQKKVEDRTYTVGYKLEYLTELLAQAVESGAYTDEQLAEIRQLARDGQFYWDFVFVENAEGAHNPTLTYDCLDRADALCMEATDLLLALTR